MNEVTNLTFDGYSRCSAKRARGTKRMRELSQEPKRRCLDDLTNDSTENFGPLWSDSDERSGVVS